MGSSRSQQVIIVDPRAGRRSDDVEFDGSKMSWIYFGRNAELFYAVKKALLNKGEMHNAGAVINAIVAELRGELINFDQHVAVDHGDPWWQVTDLAEKNPYTSDFVFRCCAYLAFDRILRGLDGDLLVFVEDWFLGRLLSDHARRLGIRARQQTGHAVADACPEWLKGTLYRGGQIVRAVSCRAAFLYRFLRRRRIIAAHGRHHTPRLDSNVDILLVTWADPQTFRSGGLKEHDTYFGELPQFLRAAGHRIAYLVNPASWVFPLEEIVANSQAAGDVAVLPEECVRPSDVLSILWTTLLHSWRVRSPFIVGGVDLTAVLRDELRREKGKSRQCLAAQYYYVGRFLRVQGVEPAMILHPYENQPWEKALRLGIKRYLPRTKVVGYQHTPFSPLWLGPYPSRGDLEAGQLPDHIITIGSRWKDLLAEHGYPPERLSTGAALRFSHLFAHSESDDGRREAPRKRSATVLVAGSIGYADSLELVCKAIEALRSLPEVSVLIKLHPKMGTNADRLLRTAIESLDLTHLPAHFAVTERPVTELLPSVDVVLHNGTSVAVEALAQGVAVVMLQSDIWFDMDTLASCPGLGAAARTPQELRHTVERLLSPAAPSVEERRRNVRTVFEEIFCPVRADTMGTFVDLCASA